MKTIAVIGFFVFLTVLAYSLSSMSTQLGKDIAGTQLPVLPNQQIALEARVTTLEGQVKELRRVVGIEGGLKEGLQNKGKKK